MTIETLIGKLTPEQRIRILAEANGSLHAALVKAKIDAARWQMALSRHEGDRDAYTREIDRRIALEREQA